jgi:hypothetical protein
MYYLLWATNRTTMQSSPEEVRLIEDIWRIECALQEVRAQEDPVWKRQLERDLQAVRGQLILSQMATLMRRFK